jgi:hypothetical protein
MLVTTAGLATLTMVIINTQHIQDTKTLRCQWRSTTFPVDTTTIATMDTTTTANPYQGQQYVDSKRPYSTGFGNATRRDVNQTTTRNNVHASNKPNNDSGQWRRGNVNISAVDVTTSFSKLCGSSNVTGRITDKPKDLICNEIQEEDVSISEAFVSLFDENKDNMLDTATLQNDPPTIAPWTTRVMLGKLVSSNWYQTGIKLVLLYSTLVPLVISCGLTLLTT